MKVDELTPEARELLAAARPAFSASAEQLARLRARRLEIPSDGPEPRVEAGAGASTGVAWTVAVVVAVVAAVVAAVIAARPPAQPEPARDAPFEERHDAPEPPAELAVAPTPVLEQAPPTKAPVAAAEPDDRATPGPRRPRARAPSLDTREPIAAPVPVAPPPETDELAAQLELIGGARRAINAEQWSRAAELVDEYTRRFPDGEFASEADVIELLSRCGARPDDDSRERARRYLARAKAPFAERVRRHCLPDGE